MQRGRRSQGGNIRSPESRTSAGSSSRARDPLSTSRGGRISRIRSTPVLRPRRSARLNPGLQQDIEERLSEPETSRHIQRRQRHRANEPAVETSASGSGRTWEADPDNLHNTPASVNRFEAMGIDKTYAVEFAVQPPAESAPQVPLYPPIVLRVHIYDASGAEVSGEDELNSLFAQATLYDHTGRTPLAPPNRYLLSGQLSRSLDLVDDVSVSASGRPPGSYVMFPDVRINRPGSYRIGISLFKVGDGGRVRSISVDSISGLDRRTGGGVSLEEAKTRVIDVHEDHVPAPRLNRSERAFLDHLRTRGVHVPSPR